MKKLYSCLLFLIVFSAFFLSCKKEGPHFIIEGKISGADTTMLYLERRSLANTTAIDSVKIGSDGQFKFEQPQWTSAEFYVLKLGNQAINLAIDSTETIALTANKSDFASNYTISGSESSAKIKEITLAQQQLTQTIRELDKANSDKTISQDEYLQQMQAAIDAYKNKATEIIRSDYKSLVAYYALFQKVGDYLIFDVYDKKDRTIFQTVATVWKQYRPTEERSIELEKLVLSILAQVRQAANQENALGLIDVANVTDETAYFDIALPDMNNKEIKLSSLKGKVVILDFTAYSTDFSPAHNILLNKVYEANKSNVAVYQISYDTNIHQWRNAAINLPWICVRDNEYAQSGIIAKYNVQGLPTTFLLNKQGQVVKRLFSGDDIEAEVKKLL